ncbi:MotA/TolQ/ExbB proton channel family protein [uncultured Roseibium sp.]|uniref:MotA/TolQ/ExbB proton channel family protein n=1 Tax=uncultured Roseibium sp. TaxID=1936171 RepID=UPI003217A9A4
MFSQVVETLPPFAQPLADLVRSGGPVVSILLGLSIVAFVLIVAKLLQFGRLKVGHHKGARKALGLWLDGSREPAIAQAASSKTVLGDILHKLVCMVGHPGTDPELLKEDIERVCNQRINTMRAYLRPLDMIAQTSPLIGLLGTVLGMIEAFQAMQGAGAAVDPSVLAGGIWVALLTTAVGLAIAIPVSAVVGWFDSRIEAEQAEMESLVTAFFTGAASERETAHAIAPGKLATAQRRAV